MPLVVNGRAKTKDWRDKMAASSVCGVCDLPRVEKPTDEDVAMINASYRGPPPTE
jgi:hypothetical protein